MRTIDDRMGVGKIAEVTDSECSVDFFHSVSRTERRRFQSQHVRPAYLTRQTRCYLRDPDSGQWIAGRIGERDGRTYEVNLPDKQSRWVADTEVYVRCDTASEDPTDTLALKAHETAVFHGTRRDLVRALVKQRALSRGLTGLTSARIELFAHQVEVVRRVLQDPVQRYLLADEVGLGKTIEAGVLIRQYLLDEADGHVVVLVPSLLVEQWRRELDGRFDAFADGRVHLLSSSHAAMAQRIPNIGMLVVDEAHHVASGASSQDPDVRAEFEACRQLAHESERVILLSATPAANNEGQFLAMLHLLDPATYRLGDAEAFRERIRLRQEIGRLLLAITENARPFSLKLSLPKLIGLFPGDPRIAELALSVLASLDSDVAGAEARISGIRAIRTHVSETYRLHRRMLRNRRDAIPDAMFDRADQRLIITRDTDELAAKLDDVIDEWRLAIVAAARRSGNVSDERRLLKEFEPLFLAIAQTADGSPALLAQLASWRLNGDTASRSALLNDFPTATLDVIRSLPYVDGEAVELERMVRLAEEAAGADHRIVALQNLLWGLRGGAGRNKPPLCVVFTGFTETARRIASRLERVLGRRSVARHIHGEPPEAVEQAVAQFRESYDCFVLVCDRSAEEGRNLQFADRIVHFDLPWHPNRLEQRIGRVDRISRIRDLTSHVLIGRDSPDSLQHAWLQLLSDGLGLFETSIASLQFYVDEYLPKLIELALRDGPFGLTEAVAGVRSAIDRERERIEEQAAIDEIDIRDDGAREFLDALDAADAAHQSLKDAVEGWMCGTLQFRRDLDERIRGAVKYSAPDRTLVPGDVLKARFSPFLNRVGVYDRTAAARNPGTALYRLGDGLIDALSDYLSWDDRGQAFAIWREDPNWNSSEGFEFVGFRFDVIVEADTGPTQQVLEQLQAGRTTPRSLDRRADGLLPPKAESVFLDAGFREVTDGALLDRLRRPFNKRPSALGVDHNLTKHRLSAIDQVIPEETWDRVCRDARSAALGILRSRPSFRQRCDEHAVHAQKKLSAQIEQLRLRAMRGESGATDEAEIEQGIGEALIDGIRVPRLRIDAAGLIVISGRGPLPLPGAPDPMPNA